MINVDGSMQLAAGHQEDLEAMLGTLRTAIELESRSDFEALGGDGTARESFLAHFGGLEEALAQWDAGVERVRAAPEALWAWFAHAAPERGIAEPRFALGPLIDRLAALTMNRSRRGQLGIPHSLNLEHFPDSVGDGLQVSVYLGGQQVATVTGHSTEQLAGNAGSADALIQALFDEAQQSAEAHAIDDAREQLLDLQEQLLDRLEQLAARTGLAPSESCPRCRELPAAAAGSESYQ